VLSGIPCWRATTLKRLPLIGKKPWIFDGQAAPYIQYAHVRANSILRKMDEALPESSKPNHELHPSEVQLIDWISRLPGESSAPQPNINPCI